MNIIGKKLSELLDIEREIETNGCALSTLIDLKKENSRLKKELLLEKLKNKTKIKL